MSKKQRAEELFAALGDMPAIEQDEKVYQKSRRARTVYELAISFATVVCFGLYALNIGFNNPVPPKATGAGSAEGDAPPEAAFNGGVEASSAPTPTPIDGDEHSIEGVNGPIIVHYPALAAMGNPVPGAHWFTDTPFGTRTHPVTGEQVFFDELRITGFDIEGAAVVAPANATVVELGDAPGTRFVWLELGGGWYVKYSHLQDITVSIGDAVNKGDIVGHVGNSEYDTKNVLGVALGFGEFNGDVGAMKVVDPTFWIKLYTLVVCGVEEASGEYDGLAEYDYVG